MDGRTDTEKVIDEAIMVRVKRGMALLQEKFGDEWVDRIDLDTLDLGETDRCVLGQVFDERSVTEEEAERYVEWVRDTCGGETPLGLSPESVLSDYNYGDGYARGKLILDGPLLEIGGPADHGFESQDESYEELAEAWESLIAPLQARRSA